MYKPISIAMYKELTSVDEIKTQVNKLINIHGINNVRGETP